MLFFFLLSYIWYILQTIISQRNLTPSRCFTSYPIYYVRGAEPCEQGQLRDKGEQCTRPRAQRQRGPCTQIIILFSTDHNIVLLSIKEEFALVNAPRHDLRSSRKIEEFNMSLCLRCSPSASSHSWPPWFFILSVLPKDLSWWRLLRRVSGPLQIHRRRLVCTLRLKLFGPSSLQNHRIPQTVPSSSFSRWSSLPSCLLLPSPQSSTLLCYSAPLFSVQTKPPDLLSPSFGSPDLFGSASMKRLHHSTQPQILSSTLRIRSATPRPCPSLQCVQAVPTQPPSPPLSPPLVTKSQFAVCSNYPNLRSKHFTGSVRSCQAWQNLMKSSLGWFPSNF